SHCVYRLMKDVVRRPRASRLRPGASLTCGGAGSGTSALFVGVPVAVVCNSASLLCNPNKQSPCHESPHISSTPAVCDIEYSMSKESVEKVRKTAELRKRGGPAATGELDPWSCDETPPDLFYVGLEQFNRGEYFEQHESLEDIWIADQRPLRRLYQ